MNSDWRLDAMAKFFNAGFIRIGADDMKTEPDAALVGRDDIYQFDDAEIAEHPIVKRLINEAVAARDAEIREALLSDGAVGLLLTAVEDDSVLAMALSARKQRGDSVVCAATLNMGRDWLTAALDHIGLHGDGTGGQG